MYLRLLLIFILNLNLVNCQIIKQCNCDKYENCLLVTKEENIQQCFSKCDSILPSTSVLPCMSIFEEVFEELKDCSYTAKSGLNGCSNRRFNFFVQRRNTEQFRDLMIHSLEAHLNDYDETRRFKNAKTAKQAECLFECIYPGRNTCTKKLGCDLLVPTEKELFTNFYKCANNQKFFEKSEFIYKCLSPLFVTDSSLRDNTTSKRRRH